RRQRGARDLTELQRRREEAEKARADALLAQHEAERQRQELLEKMAQFEREAQATQALREARANLQANDLVHVPRYDKVGRIVRVDYKRSLAVVSLGTVEWVGTHV